MLNEVHDFPISHSMQQNELQSNQVSLTQSAFGLKFNLSAAGETVSTDLLVRGTWILNLSCNGTNYIGVSRTKILM